jgi:transcriptional regulator with XRE-family HTH domain
MSDSNSKLRSNAGPAQATAAAWSIDLFGIYVRGTDLYFLFVVLLWFFFVPPHAIGADGEVGFMSIADYKMEAADIPLAGAVPVPQTGASPQGSPTNSGKPRLHCIASVREQQGMSLRSVARRMDMDVSELKLLERETTDMLLSTLYKWQAALDVPVSSLLVDQDDPLSEPVLKRARMIRLMKTAAALHDRAESKPIQRLATMLIEQLVEIMPELKDVSAWHAVGQRRSLDECGRIAEQTLPDDWFFSANG